MPGLNSRAGSTTKNIPVIRRRAQEHGTGIEATPTVMTLSDPFFVPELGQIRIHFGIVSRWATAGVQGSCVLTLQRNIDGGAYANVSPNPIIGQVQVAAGGITANNWPFSLHGHLIYVPSTATEVRHILGFRVNLTNVNMVATMSVNDVATLDVVYIGTNPDLGDL